MSPSRFRSLRLSDKDLDFLVETVSPGVTDKPKLKQIIREDEGFRNTFIDDEKVSRRLVNEQEAFLKISPALFFEVLLRKVAKDLKGVSCTIEKTGTTKIPVFDTKDVVEFLAKESLLDYLADMLSSFTRIETYAFSIQIGEHIFEKIRVNDLDMLSLMELCEAVEDTYRFRLYKRIADICLFIIGIFPDYAEYDYRYPFSGQLRPQIRGKTRMSLEDYEKEGRKFYKSAAEHPSARELDLSEVFWALHEDFQKAKKPLNFVAEHYLRYKR
ncbi:MAG TPA: hypothetical protein VEM15_15040, partial [Thermodesulfobacteriota bacterium]|nr:hypothetical protein [Thermodesulfobacteriota bacterium]